MISIVGNVFNSFKELEEDIKAFEQESFVNLGADGMSKCGMGQYQSRLSCVKQLISLWQENKEAFVGEFSELNEEVSTSEEDSSRTVQHENPEEENSSRTVQHENPEEEDQDQEHHVQSLFELPVCIYYLLTCMYLLFTYLYVSTVYLPVCIYHFYILGDQSILNENTITGAHNFHILGT